MPAQEKCIQEVDQVIGADRSPSLLDRQGTPYVEATIQARFHFVTRDKYCTRKARLSMQEMMRHSPHMALTLSHWLTEDMEFRGHHFPKGTQVVKFYNVIFNIPKMIKLRVSTTGFWLPRSDPHVQRDFRSGRSDLSPGEVRRFGRRTVLPARAHSSTLKY